MSANAGDTVERISRGHFRLSIIQHGIKMDQREVQLWDTVEQRMISGTTEKALIASMLLDPRTAAKHFESVKAGSDLAAVDSPSKLEGFQEVIKSNPRFSKPPVKQAMGFRLRENVDMTERLAKAEILDAEPVAEEPDRPTPTRDTEDLDVPPEVFTERFEYEGADAKGLFMSLCAAFGVDRIGEFLTTNDPGGALSLGWVAAMSEELTGDHHLIEEDTPEPDPETEKKTGRKRKKKDKAPPPVEFDPTKK